MHRADGFFPPTSKLVVIGADGPEVSAQPLRARAWKLTCVAPSGWKKPVCRYQSVERPDFLCWWYSSFWWEKNYLLLAPENITYLGGNLPGMHWLGIDQWLGCTVVSSSPSVSLCSSRFSSVFSHPLSGEDKDKWWCCGSDTCRSPQSYLTPSQSISACISHTSLISFQRKGRLTWQIS